MNNLKRLQLVLAIAGAVFAFAGCQTSDSGAAAPPPPVSQAPADQPQAPQPAAGGMACSRCVCSHFEPQSDAPGTCRMCGHSSADHTRAM